MALTCLISQQWSLKVWRMYDPQGLYNGPSKSSIIKPVYHDHASEWHGAPALTTVTSQPGHSIKVPACEAGITPAVTSHVTLTQYTLSHRPYGLQGDKVDAKWGQYPHKGRSESDQTLTLCSQDHSRPVYGKTWESTTRWVWSKIVWQPMGRKSFSVILVFKTPQKLQLKFCFITKQSCTSIVLCRWKYKKDIGRLQDCSQHWIQVFLWQTWFHRIFLCSRHLRSYNLNSVSLLNNLVQALYIVGENTRKTMDAFKIVLNTEYKSFYDKHDSTEYQQFTNNIANTVSCQQKSFCELGIGGYIYIKKISANKNVGFFSEKIGQAYLAYLQWPFKVKFFW